MRALNEHKLIIEGRKIKPFKKVKYGDTGTDTTGEEFVVVAKGTAQEMVDGDYDESGMTEEGIRDGYIDPNEDAVAVEMPNKRGFKGTVAWTYDEGGAVVYESVVNEASETQKFIAVNPAIGKAKYSLDVYDGQTHKDGSPFVGIKISKNKKEQQKAIVDFIEKGYDIVGNVLDAIKANESAVNEGYIAVGTKIKYTDKDGKEKTGEVKTVQSRTDNGSYKLDNGDIVDGSEILEESTVNEKMVDVTKKMWDKMSDEEQEDALLSAASDPDATEKFVGFKYDKLPSWVKQNMAIDESVINESLKSFDATKISAELLKQKKPIVEFTQLITDILEQVYDNAEDTDLAMDMADAAIKDLTKLSQELGDM
jgi:hypothetical protein